MSQASSCALCGDTQNLTLAPSYKILACQRCWHGAEHGWPAAAEPALFKALAAQGLLIPDRDDKGRLPRTYAPPADYAL